MSESLALNDAARADDALAVWSRHNARLLTFGVGSMLAATAFWLASAGPDGRDPFYVALAIEFVIWGAINAAFGGFGARDVQRVRAIEASDARTKLGMEKAKQILRVLRINGWLNALWLTTGAVLVALGYLVFWSASLCGHGYAILAQAIVLTVMDMSFIRGLRLALR